MPAIEMSMSGVSKDEVRRMAARIALHNYGREPCRICGRAFTVEDFMEGAAFAELSTGRAPRVAHRVCWANFVELLRMLPAQRLYELVSEGKEAELGQRSATEGSAQ